MKEKKNIDRLFQEKFKDFEASPNEKVWKNIKTELQKENDRKVIPIWWYRIAGAAAVIALLFLAGNFWLGPQENSVVNSTEEIKEENIQQPNKPFTSSESKTKSSYATSTENTSEGTGNTQTQTPNPKNSQQDALHTNTSQANSGRVVESNSSVENSSSSHSRSVASTGNKPSEANNSNRNASEKENISKIETKATETNLKQSSSIASKTGFEESTSTEKNSLAENTSEEENNAIDKNKSIAENDEGTEDEKKSLVDTAKEIEENKEGEEDSEEKENDEQNLSKWLIKPNISPIYYGSLNGGNSIDKSLANNSSGGEVSMAYGVNFAYSVSEKFKIRSGVSKVNMSYNVNDIAFSPAVNAIQLEGINSPSNESIQVLSTNRPQNAADAANNNNEFGRAETPNLSPGTLNQQLGYIEVPLEIEYALLDKRFGVNLIGGASTLFLDKNAVVINSGEGQISLGEANNLNNVSFTTNLGLGLDYNLNKQFDLNLEPTFKYQLNGFSNNVNNFKPYYFGIYTGFSFKF